MDVILSYFDDTEKKYKSVSTSSPFPVADGSPSTNDATATQADVLEPKTAYGANGKITGTIKDFTGMSPVQVTWQGGVPTEVRIQVPATGFYDSQNPIYPFFAFDPNFLAENIRQGVSIFGLNGSYTSDADATAADIRAGKTAYINGQKITGTAVF